MKSIYVSLFIISLFLANCATSSAGMATSNIPIVDQKYKVIGPVEKQVSWFTLDFAIFGFPLQKPPIDTIINEAIAEQEADALINIRYWQDRTIFAFLVRNRLGLNAEAIKFNNVGISVGGK